MNHSFYSADRATHLKIVVVALVAATAVAGITITARVNAGDTYAQTNQIQVIKAGKPVMVTTTDKSVASLRGRKQNSIPRLAPPNGCLGLGRTPNA